MPDSMTPDDGPWYRGFTLDHDEADAAARFTQRYGRPPERIFEEHGILLVGPVPEGRERADAEAQV